jgi:hypothetical protein
MTVRLVTLLPEPERLARVDRERDAVDRAHEAVLAIEGDVQVLDVEEGGHEYRTRGSMNA